MLMSSWIISTNSRYTRSPEKTVAAVRAVALRHVELDELRMQTDVRRGREGHVHVRIGVGDLAGAIRRLARRGEHRLGAVEVVDERHVHPVAGRGAQDERLDSARR